MVNNVNSGDNRRACLTFVIRTHCVFFPVLSPQSSADHTQGFAYKQMVLEAREIRFCLFEFLFFFLCKILFEPLFVRERLEVFCHMAAIKIAK